MAIVSDALHDFGDSLSLGLSWFLEKQKGKDAKHSYGYRRFSVLGALTTTVVLIIGSGFVLSVAIPRLIHPKPSLALGMLFLAIVEGKIEVESELGKNTTFRLILPMDIDKLIGKRPEYKDK